MPYVKIDEGPWNNDFSVSASLSSVSEVVLEEPDAPSAVGARSTGVGTTIDVVEVQNDIIFVRNAYIVCTGGATAELGFTDTSAVFRAKIKIPANGTISMDGMKMFDAFSRPGSQLVLKQTAAGAVECYTDGYHVKRHA